MRLVLFTKPANRGVVGIRIGSNDLISHIRLAVLFNLSAGTLAGTVRIDQQGYHHRWMKGCITDPISTVFFVKRRQVDLFNSIKNKPSQMISR